MYSMDAEKLLMGTGAVESGYTYLRQLNGGPARSFWQIEPATAKDNIINYLQYRPQIWDDISKACDVPLYYIDSDLELSSIARLLENNIAFAISMARIKYRRVPSQIPGDVKAQAEYWLIYYNAGGKGTIDKYINALELIT